MNLYDDEPDGTEPRMPRGLEWVLMLGAAIFCALAYVAGQALGWWL